MEEYAINKPIEDPAKLGVLRRRKWTLQRSMGEILPKHSSQYSAGDVGLPSRADTGVYNKQEYLFLTVNYKDFDGCVFMRSTCNTEHLVHSFS